MEKRLEAMKYWEERREVMEILASVPTYHLQLRQVYDHPYALVFLDISQDQNFNFSPSMPSDGDSLKGQCPAPVR